MVFGSLAGEYAGARGWLGDLWFWLGHQGWEYLDLGRLWQILLVIGLFLWVFILFRGLRGTLREEHFGNMPWLLFYAALAIPAFYAVGLLTSPHKGFVVNDFWRFWVVHLWVEDFLELFTTVIVAYMFVLLGVVREATALRVIYLDIILYSLGGVLGTMHHLYFSGTPVAHMALGATFSAMEVIPLMLLTLEAWSFIKSGEKQTRERYHMHRWAVRFLVAVGVWNFLGAGVFGFLINLPVVSYYEIGTALTANHGHTAMMGVYGMLAAGLLLFCLRYLTETDKWRRSRCHDFVLVVEYRLDLDGFFQSFSTGYRATLSCGRHRLLACAQPRLSHALVGERARMGPAAGRRCVHSRRRFSSSLALLARRALSQSASHRSRRGIAALALYRRVRVARVLRIRHGRATNP